LYANLRRSLRYLYHWNLLRYLHEFFFWAKSFSKSFSYIYTGWVRTLCLWRDIRRKNMRYVIRSLLFQSQRMQKFLQSFHFYYMKTSNTVRRRSLFVSWRVFRYFITACTSRSFKFSRMIRIYNHLIILESIIISFLSVWKYWRITYSFGKFFLMTSTVYDLPTPVPPTKIITFKEGTLRWRYSHRSCKAWFWP